MSAAGHVHGFLSIHVARIENNPAPLFAETAKVIPVHLVYVLPVELRRAIRTLSNS